MVEIGNRVTEYIPGLNTHLSGTVIWIHPKQRFYRVKFESLTGSFVESFKCDPGSKRYMKGSFKRYELTPQDLEEDYG